MKFSQTGLILDIAVFLLAIIVDLLWISWRKSHPIYPSLKREVKLFYLAINRSLIRGGKLLSLVYVWINKSLSNFLKNIKTAREKSMPSQKRGGRLISITNNRLIVRVAEQLSFIHLWINKSLLGLLKHKKTPREKSIPSTEPIFKKNSTKIVEKLRLMRENLLNQFLTWWENGHPIFATKNSAEKLAPDLKRWQAIVEIGVIALIVWTYCWGFLDLGQHTILPGNESENNQILDKIFYNALHQSGHLIAWNSSLFSGLPMVGNPMFHFFNPLVGLPILLFGVADGFKIALFLSFVVGAVGMWFMALTFGMKPVARLWMALLFAFAGQPTARYFQGEYLFVFGWAFIPWIIGGLHAVYSTRRRIYAALTAFALAGIFLSGNAYYAFFTFFIILLFLCVFLFTFSRKKPILSINWSTATLYVLIGLVAIGLIAIQLLPTYQLWPRISKAEDNLGSANLGQVAMDFLSNDSFRPDMYSILPAREEFYAFIGLTPFLFLLLLPVVMIRRNKPNKRNLLFAFLLLLMSFLWIDLKDMPWAQLYNSMQIFAQFRYQVRMIIYTEIALLLLMGYSLDSTLQVLWNTISKSSVERAYWVKRIPSLIGAGVVLGLAGYSILIVYTTNRTATFTAAIYDPPYQPFSWLDHYDQSIFYTRINPNNASYDAGISNHMRLLEPWNSFNDIRLQNDGTNQRTVQAHPNYIIQSPTDTPPPNSKIIKTFPDYVIYHSLDALPFSFSVKNQTLATPNADELKLHDVIPQTTYSPNGDSMEIVADSSSDSTLVTLVTNFPGWVARIDGQPVKLYSVNGYLAISMRTGVHQYTFSFESGALKTGIIISLISLLVILYWALSDLNWAKAWARLRKLTSPGHKNWDERIRNNPITVFFQGISTRQSLEFSLLGLNIQVKRNSKQVKQVVSLGMVLFIASLIVYGVIHFVGIKQYPIYFFSDEANPSLYAQGLIKNHFMDDSGNYFPLYFEESGSRWAPLLSTYPEGIGSLLFGNSVSTTRGTSAAISFLAVISLAIILKRVFKARYWWIGVLILGLIPAWFLHSRTAFETAMMCAFYAVFLLFYELYLTESPKYIFPAFLFAGLTFYTYSNGQTIIGVTFILLLISDFRYHLKNWHVNLWALLLGLIIMIPLIQFLAQHPSGFAENLDTLGSYWFSDISFFQKILTFLQKYGYGLSPQYWFFSNGQDLTRHTMGDFGNIWLEMLPFFLIGLVVFLWHFRTAKYRTILLAMLAIPVSSALVDIGITRVLSFVIPAALLISIGCNWLLELISKRSLSNWIALLTFTGLSIASIMMLQTALNQAPFWDKDYGLYGMQWGATQLFEHVIPKYLAADPKNQILMSSAWANGSDRFIPYFLSEKDQQRVCIGTLEDFTISQGNLNSNVFFISTPSEYNAIKVSNKFEKITVDQIVPYPDGTPGFYVLQAAYKSGVEDIFAKEKEERKQLIVENYNLDGQNLVVRHSLLDMGEIKNLFDNDPSTLIRGFEANPFIIEIEFPQPQPIQSISFETNSINIHVTALLFPSGDPYPKKFEDDYQYDDSTGIPANLVFNGGPYLIKRLRVEILNKDVAPDSQTNIHVREFHWK